MSENKEQIFNHYSQFYFNNIANLYESVESKLQFISILMIFSYYWKIMVFPLSCFSELLQQTTVNAEILRLCCSTSLVDCVHGAGLVHSQKYALANQRCGPLLLRGRLYRWL